MTKKHWTIFAVALVALGLIIVKLDPPKRFEPYHAKDPKIFLYGEWHGKEAYLEREFQIWKAMYDQGHRDLFVEEGYPDAQLKNIWMKAEDDRILEFIYGCLNGAEGAVPVAMEFDMRIKKECPETIFHGTDVCHQHETIGKKYLEYLEENGQKDSKEYKLALENIQQGKDFYETRSMGQREGMMTENFIRAYDEVKAQGREVIMGIYGSYHTDPRVSHVESDTMAKMLKDHYGDIIESDDIERQLKEGI